MRKYTYEFENQIGTKIVKIKSTSKAKAHKLAKLKLKDAFPSLIFHNE